MFKVFLREGWHDAGSGLFVQWGSYAIPTGEWQGGPTPGISEWFMARATRSGESSYCE